MYKIILKYQKVLSLGVGTIMLLGALGVLFWSNQSSTQMSKEEQYARANLARMEAKVKNKSVNTKKSTKPLKQFYESRDKQLRYLMIAMLITGVGFLGYGVFKKS
jgi:hypothetical protein